MGTGAKRHRPTFEIEAAAYERCGGLVAGIDEAGRGPWAGPVVAAAVVLNCANIPDGIDDSKALDPTDRLAAYARVMSSAIHVGIGVAHVRDIDCINILNATMMAMRLAMGQLPVMPALALIDGNRAPNLACEARTIVEGDARCLSIAAASIIAKVTRDRLMVALGAKFPRYGFERHKGYGTPEHHAALTAHGPIAQHRRSFRPVQVALGLVTDDDLASNGVTKKGRVRKPCPMVAEA